MSYGGNFNTEVNLINGVLQVTGQSGAIPGAVLVARRVAVQQPPAPCKGGQFIEGPDTDLSWNIELNPASYYRASLSNAVGLDKAPKFTAGKDALAIGTETYFMPRPVVDNTAAQYVTQTWSQVVSIVSRTVPASYPVRNHDAAHH